MAFFSKNKSKEGEGKGEDTFQRDPRKARRFFEHAQAVADARNYDYAVECYINGLRHEPEALDKHEALMEVALKRKASGGKPAGLGEKFKSGGPAPLDKMLHAEKLWAKDPRNVKLMRDVMKWAVDADEQDESVDLAEFAYWVGNLLLDFNAQAKRPDKALYLEARDLFARIEGFDKAVEACRRALAMDPNNAKLLVELKNLDAERTMKEGGYSDAKTAQEGGFRQFMRDSDKQRELEQEQSLHKTGSAVDEIIARRRVEYDEDPQDYDRLLKLVEALVQRETNESEAEAMNLLRLAWDESGQYRYKVRIGDIQMKQFNRIVRQLAVKRKAEPGDEETRKKYEEAVRRRLIFELQEFTERVKNYPTDMGLRFELGKRLYLAGKFDEAIAAFQQAKADPKHRSGAHEYLGRCYLQKDWLDEAIDTIRQGIEAHPLTDDRPALEMRYLLMGALEKSAAKSGNVEQAREAQKIGSAVLQSDIGFRDIRDRMDQIRKLVDKLGNGGNGGKADASD